MTLTKQDLIKVIDQEIEDRTIQASESGEEQGYTEELKFLRDIRTKVCLNLSLSYPQYEWLASLAAQDREAAIRSELE